MAEANENTEVWKPSQNPWLVVLPAVFAAFMFVLDVGLGTDYFEKLPSCDFTSVVTGIEFNYN